jgi:hypothetical protein
MNVKLFKRTFGLATAAFIVLWILSHNVETPKRRVTIEWSPTPGAIAYRILYGTADDTKTNTVGPQASATVYLVRGRTNYIQVIAILPNGEESLPSTNLVISP